MKFVEFFKNLKFKSIFKTKEKKNDFDGGFVVDTAILEEAPEEETLKRTFVKEVFEWLEVLVTAVIAVVVIFSMFFRVATIDGSSMLNTLVGADPYSGTIGDRVIISNLAYTPKYGDIVVISRNVENSTNTQSSSQGPIIKRVIAVGGQTVDIDFETATVYVDGKALDEPYISTPTDSKYDVDFPVYVPEGSIFVLGDNRQNSLDSRSSYIGDNGLIDTRYILGRAIYRIFPFNRIGGLDSK